MQYIQGLSEHPNPGWTVSFGRDMAQIKLTQGNILVLSRDDLRTLAVIIDDLYRSEPTESQ
jgi:hypothetical protein